MNLSFHAAARESNEIYSYLLEHTNASAQLHARLERKTAGTTAISITDDHDTDLCR